MKLLASIGPEYIVFSVHQHDYLLAPDGTMADGGQPGLQFYAGYSRHSYGSRRGWVELPGGTFADLVNDYNCSSCLEGRKYGIHRVGELRELEQHEAPRIESLFWRVSNAVWGSRGKDGQAPLRYLNISEMEDSHLSAVLENCSHIKGQFIEQAIKYVLHLRGQNAEGGPHTRLVD